MHLSLQKPILLNENLSGEKEDRGKKKFCYLRKQRKKMGGLSREGNVIAPLRVGWTWLEFQFAKKKKAGLTQTMVCLCKQ